MSTATRSRRARVFLVDDHPLVREWLASMITHEPDLELCGQAEDAAAALAAVSLARPDVVVVDLTLAGGSGLELIKDLRARFPSIKPLVFTTHDDAGVAERSFRAGARGYVNKRDPAPRIIEAIRAVAEGRFFASPELAAQLAGRMFSGNASDGGSPLELLSDREMEAFRLKGAGHSAKEIAGLMHVSVKTVGSYEARIKEKLGLGTAGELMREAVLWNDRHGSR